MNKAPRRTTADYDTPVNATEPYKGRKRSLAADKAAELKRRAAAGENKAALAREFQVDRTTVYRYLARQDRSKGKGRA